MDASKLKFDFKTIGALLVIASMWYDLKTDFAVHKEEHKLLEYRIASLEAMNTYRAVIPKETKIEKEEKN